MRITPAWAGKRFRVPRQMPRPQDHPRMGGEKFLSLNMVQRQAGSPPHGRGKVRDDAAAHALAGITPAWAGKRGQPVKRASKAEDHPRVGGEKWSRNPTAKKYTGSPPRGRGKGEARTGRDTRHGITPAWAGKRNPHRVTNPVGVDHPRVGGEKRRTSWPSTQGRGSPPRGRGKEPKRVPNEPGNRITPAWAGKRHKAVLSSGRNGDHPRVGGEKRQNLGPHTARKGSPPRGRGKAQRSQPGLAGPGITPAWAGKRKKKSSHGQFLRDHPRVGGEKAAYFRAE